MHYIHRICRQSQGKIKTNTPSNVTEKSKTRNGRGNGAPEALPHSGNCETNKTPHRNNMDTNHGEKSYMGQTVGAGKYKPPNKKTYKTGTVPGKHKEPARGQNQTTTEKRERNLRPATKLHLCTSRKQRPITKSRN